MKTVYAVDFRSRTLVHCNVEWASTWYLGLNPIQVPGEIQTKSVDVVVSDELAELLIKEKKCKLVPTFVR